MSPSVRSLRTPTLESRLGNSAHGVRSAVFFYRTKAAPSLSPLHLYTEHTPTRAHMRVYAHTLCAHLLVWTSFHTIQSCSRTTHLCTYPLLSHQTRHVQACAHGCLRVHTHICTHTQDTAPRQGGQSTGPECSFLAMDFSEDLRLTSHSDCLVYSEL